MNLSASARYAMIVMGYIGKQSKGRSVSSIEIAKEFKLPDLYLMKIFTQLICAGLLYSKRGPKGGFSLAKPAKEISLLEILEAGGGPVHDSYQIADDAKNQPFAKKMDMIHSKATDRIIAILKKAKLSDMVK